MKSTITDLKKNANIVSPDLGYVRLKAGIDNTIQAIYPDGRVRTITHAWEIPTEDFSETDPSLLTPTDWSRYLVPNGSIGDWAGHDQDIAMWNPNSSSWEFTTPEQGWGTYLKSENQIYTFNGTEWVKLTASQTTIEVTYDELRLLIRNNSLIEGNLYRITDYQSYNQINHYLDIIHTSGTREFLCQAISNNQLQATVTDMSDINDLIVYDPSMTADGWFYVIVEQADGVTIEDSDEGFDENFLWDYNNGDYFRIEFLSNTQVFLGYDTIIEDDTVLTVGHGGIYANITIGAGDALWDSSTGILTLLNGYTYDNGPTYYYFSASARYAARELRKGRVLSREDLVNAIKCDFDWREHQYALFSGELDMYNIGTPWYCSPHQYEIGVQNPRLDQAWGNTSRDILHSIDVNDYELRPFLTGTAKNLTVSNTRYLVLENCNIDGATFLGGDGGYFIGVDIRNATFDYLTRVIALPSANIMDTDFSRLTTAVLHGTVTDSNLSVDRCLIRNIGNTTMSLLHIAMNDSSHISSITGSIGTIQLNDTTHLYSSELKISNTIFQNGSTIGYSSIKGDGVHTRLLFDNTQVLYANFIARTGELVRHVYFENLNITELDWTGSMEGSDGIGNQVYFPVIDTSDVTGVMPEEIFAGMEIHNNTITHNVGYILPVLNLNFFADTSAGSIAFELPSNPYDGLRYTFGDISGNASISNITVNVSSAPAGGVINTINGLSTKVIDLDYGILVLQYSNVGGWIIVQESVVQVPETTVDYDTIEFIPSRATVSRVSQEELLYADAWNRTGFTNQSGIGNNNDPVNGAVYIPKNVTSLLYCYTDPVWPLPAVDNTPILPNGTYRLYSIENLVPYGLHLREDTRYAGWRTIYATSVEENGLWRHDFVVSLGDFRMSRIFLDTSLPHSSTYWLIMIDGFPATGNDISITGIDRIINADGYATGDYIQASQDANREVVSKKYVDNTANNPDDVTIEGIVDTNIPYSTENDMQLVFEDAYGHDIRTDTFAWVTGSPSLTAGVFSLNLADDGGGFCEDYQGIVIRANTSGVLPNREAWNAYIHTNLAYDGTNQVWLYTSNYALPFDEIINLADGTFLYRFAVPKGSYKIITGMQARVVGGTVPLADQPWFRLVRYGEYPPKKIIKIKNIDHIIDDDFESIDGSDTPMSDPHREIPTRAYVDRVISAGLMTDVTYSELKALIDSSTLSAGTLYRIYDFESWNRKAPDTATYHSSGALPIIVRAINNSEIGVEAFDQDNPTDIIKYDVENEQTLNFMWREVSGFMPPSLNTEITDENGDTIPINPPILDNTHNSSTEWSLGTDVDIDLATLVISTEHATNPDLTGADVSWDPVTGILTCTAAGRSFEESRTMGMTTYRGATIISGASRVHPERPMGKIIYREDTVRNIKADFDWRYAVYTRYTALVDTFLGGHTNAPFLAENTAFSIGRDGAGTYINMSSDGTSADYPAINLANEVYNIELQSCNYVVIDYPEFYNVKLKEVNNSSFMDSIGGGLNECSNLEIFNANRLYVNRGLSNVIITDRATETFLSGTHYGVTYRELRNSYIYRSVQHSEFDTIMQSNGFADIVQNVTLKGITFNQNVFRSNFQDCSVSATYFGNSDIGGSFTDNDIFAQGDFGITITGDFEGNTLSVSQFRNIVITGDFNNNIVEGGWAYLNLQNVNDSKFEDDVIRTWSSILTETEDIVNSGIYLDNTHNNHVLQDYTMTYVLDSSVAPFDLELPANPVQNMRLIFVDELGNSFANNVTLNVSSAPSAGVVNTINGSGGSAYTIATDYAFVELIYTGNGGWIVMKESQTTVVADDVTIEENAGHVFSLKNTDYIIGLDNRSVDASSTLASNPTREVVNKEYVDNNTYIAPIRLIETGVNVALTGVQTIDGSNTATGDRIAVMGQTIGSENGFYIADDGGAWVRTSEAPLNKDVAGKTFYVREGATYGNTEFVISNAKDSGVIGTDTITVQLIFSTQSIQWAFTNSDRLEPVNASVLGVEIERNHNGYTWLTLRNTDTGNGAGAVIELHKSNTAYQDNMYIGIYSDGYWLNFLQGNGAVFTTENLIIGSADNTKEIRFVIGDSYVAPVQVGTIDANGLTLDSLTSSTANPASYLNVMVDTATGRLYANTTGVTSVGKQIDDFTVDATIMANQYIDLSQTIDMSKHNIVIVQSSHLMEGIDYTVDVGNNRIVFLPSASLWVGALIQVKYEY